MACLPSGKWRAFQAAEPLRTVVGGVTVHVSFADVLFKLKTRVGRGKVVFMIFWLFVMIIQKRCPTF